MITLKTPSWEINNIDTVLFDKDGTLIDLHHFWGEMTKLRSEAIIDYYKLPLSSKETICNILGYNINDKKMLPDGITAMYSRSKIIEFLNKDLINLGIKTSENILEKIFDDVSNIFYKNIHEHTKPINSALDFVVKLYNRGIKMGIVTSDSLISTNMTIKQFEWDKYFTVAVGRETSKLTKESGALTKIALKTLNANPENTLMIGDAPMDHVSAQNAGIKHSILVATGQINKQELAKVSNFTVNNLSEINLIYM